MSLINIDIASGTVVSESAARKVAYKIAKVNGVTTLVINSSKKADLTSIVASLKRAKTEGLAALAASVKANTASTKARTATTKERKASLKQTAKDEKAKVKTHTAQFKQHLKAANTAARQHGLGGLNLGLSASDLATGVNSSKSVKAIRAAKLNEFGVTGKRGTFKPKFLVESKFEELGQKKSTKKYANDGEKRIGGQKDREGMRKKAQADGRRITGGTRGIRNGYSGLGKKA